MLRNWRRRRLLRSRQIPEATWRSAWHALPLLHGLTAEEEQRLRDLVLLFLHEKVIEPAGGLVIDEAMRITLAAQACLPILNLGLDCYDGWHAVILYPDEFVPHLHWTDEAGVEHEADEIRSGEAWVHGPVILSWEDVRQSGRGDGYNVVIHELAHKLDAGDGEMNGMPALHPEMSAAAWSRDFSAAFEELEVRLNRGEETFIDPYAAEAPEEFFAVASEYFFELPVEFDAACPAVYRQLARFYRQDPARRVHWTAPAE
jgi:Mlc titration factor MtfA (ptsG expression regulator)